MVIKKDDELVMKLLYYFINEEGYNPIVLHGAKDEVWLEKLNGEYKIVRIVSDYIHNNEQYKNDLYKAKRILKDIKRKTLSLKMPTLSIFTNLSDNVDLKSFENIECVNLKNQNEIKKFPKMMEVFPTIESKINFEEKGVDLFKKLTKRINERNLKESKKAEEIFTPKKPNVTNILITINIFIFILMNIYGNGSYDNETLLNYGALVGNLVKEGEIYRLFTSAFLHGSLIHLFFNMWALKVLGKEIEGFYGPKKFIVIYLYSTLIGSLLSVILLPINIISVGASGAIFGLFGSLLYFGYHNRVYMGTTLKTQLIPILILNLFLSFAISNINAAAHIGGLIGGILISAAVKLKYKTTSYEQSHALIMTAILTSFLIYMSFLH